jgi:hypothetical protein
MSRIRSSRWFNRVTTTPAVALAVVSWCYIARADAVLDWNAIAANAFATASPPRPVPVSFLDMAVVQAAVYNAVESDRRQVQTVSRANPGSVGLAAGGGRQGCA